MRFLQYSTIWSPRRISRPSRITNVHPDLHRINIFTSNKSSLYHKQYRFISLLNKAFLPSSLGNKQLISDINEAVHLVRKFDPAGYLPGLLVSSNEGKIGYFAIRSFWIQSGLRFETLNNLQIKNNKYRYSNQISGIGQKAEEIPVKERIQRWRAAVDSLYHDKGDSSLWNDNATLRLLHNIIHQHDLSKSEFDRVLNGREKDFTIKQYSNMQRLIEHAEISCSSLIRLVLQCVDISEIDEETVIYDTARHIGIAHGLTIALRTSVPVASATGKIIIPEDLCQKYGVKSPRYLLSALGMGDLECKRHMQSAVKDIVDAARENLMLARANRCKILSNVKGDKALTVFLPAIVSETFLDRLQAHNYDLTDRKLRQVGFQEHLMCATRTLSAWQRSTF